MRLKALPVVAVFLSLLILSWGLSPRTYVSAESPLQNVPHLDGMKIYFSESNGEASRFDRSDTGISRLAGLLRQLGARLHTVDWRSRLPSDADLIIIPGPLTDLSADQAARLWSYLSNGGHLLLLANPVVETTSSQGLPAVGGVFQLFWNDMGLRGRNDVVVTEGTSQPEATEEPGTAPQSALTAQFVAANLNSDHPITAALDEELTFFVSRSIEFDASIQDVRTTPLIFTDSNFYGEMAYAAYLESGTVAYEVGIDTARGPLALAAAFEDPNLGTRVVVIGDREFVTNGKGFQTSPPGSASFVYPGNVRFTINAITWLLSADTVSLSLPTPGPTSTPSLTPSPTFTATMTPDITATPTPDS